MYGDTNIDQPPVAKARRRTAKPKGTDPPSRHLDILQVQNRALTPGYNTDTRPQIRRSNQHPCNHTLHTRTLTHTHTPSPRAPPPRESPFSRSHPLSCPVPSPIPRPTPPFLVLVAPADVGGRGGGWRVGSPSILPPPPGRLTWLLPRALPEQLLRSDEHRSPLQGRGLSQAGPIDARPLAPQALPRQVGGRGSPPAWLVRSPRREAPRTECPRVPFSPGAGRRQEQAESVRPDGFIGSGPPPVPSPTDARASRAQRLSRGRRSCPIMSASMRLHSAA